MLFYSLYITKLNNPMGVSLYYIHIQYCGISFQIYYWREINKTNKTNKIKI